MRRATVMFCAFAAALVVTLPRAGRAQLTEVQPGARVRVQAPGVVAGQFVGTVLQRTSDTVRIGAPNALPVDVPVSRISSFEISRGSSRTLGAGVGALWGTGVGAVIGLLTLTEASYYSSEGGAAYVLGSALGGAIWGAGIGALVGRERWDTFDLGRRSTVIAEPARGRLGVSIAF